MSKKKQIPMLYTVKQLLQTDCIGVVNNLLNDGWILILTDEIKKAPLSDGIKDIFETEQGIKDIPEHFRAYDSENRKTADCLMRRNNKNSLKGLFGILLLHEIQQKHDKKIRIIIG